MDTLIFSLVIMVCFATLIRRVVKLERSLMRKVGGGFQGVIELLTEISDSLNLIESYLRPEGMAQRIEFYAIINGLETKVNKMNLQQGEKAKLALKIKDKGGNPAKVQDDKVAWSVSDESLGTLNVAADGMSAEYIPNGKTGSLVIQAKGDADLGEGVKEIMGEVTLDILSGEAVVFELSAEAAPQ